MLFTADVPYKVEQHLLAIDGERLHSDILKVGHHGSRTSTSNAFLAAIAPGAAVISVGSNNRYGHPTRDVLERLLGRAIQTYRTDEEGTVVFISDGKEFFRKH